LLENVVGSIDDVRDQLSIEDVVGEFVQLKKAGATLKGLCPFHHEKSPSFIVTPSRGRYHCFGCGVDGDIFKFVMEKQGVEFRDALQMLADKAGVTLDAPGRGNGEDDQKSRIYEMNAAAAMYVQQMLGAPAGAEARAYLERRAITAKTIADFGLGYAPGRGELCKRLRDAGYSDEEMVGAGLAVASEEGGSLRDRFYARLMFPIRDVKGNILGFGGRVLDDSKPKYLNTQATPVFDKSRVLYAIEHAVDAIRGAREVVVVEGYMDALRAHQAGFTNVVATLGTAITEQNLRAINSLGVGLRLVLALDADPAGQRAAVKAGLTALKALPKKRADGTKRETARILVATLPEGQDPDDAIAADPEVWRRAVAGAAPLMDHYVALVEAGLDHTKPEWREEAIETLLPAIGELDGVGLQQTYIERLAALTGVEARLLRDKLPGAPRQMSAGGRDGPRRERIAAGLGPGPPLPDAVDPVRTTEEYLVGTLLLHRPLPPEVRAELETYAPSTAELAPLLAAILRGDEPAPAQEEAVERLAASAVKGPPVASLHLPGQVRDLLMRVNRERSRRELLDLGQALLDVDPETAREFDDRVLRVMALKEQAEVRYQREQTQYRRQPAAIGDEEF